MNAPQSTDLESIRARDASAGKLWFTGPESFTALAARDRRALLSEIEQLRKDKEINTVNAATVQRLEAEIERLRTEYAACIATVDRLENGTTLDVGDEHGQ